MLSGDDFNEERELPLDSGIPILDSAPLSDLPIGNDMDGRVLPFILSSDMRCLVMDSVRRYVAVETMKRQRGRLLSKFELFWKASRGVFKSAMRTRSGGGSALCTASMIRRILKDISRHFGNGVFAFSDMFTMGYEWDVFDNPYEGCIVMRANPGVIEEESVVVYRRGIAIGVTPNLKLTWCYLDDLPNNASVKPVGDAYAAVLNEVTYVVFGSDFAIGAKGTLCATFVDSSCTLEPDDQMCTEALSDHPPAHIGLVMATGKNVEVEGVLTFQIYGDDCCLAVVEPSGSLSPLV